MTYMTQYNSSMSKFAKYCILTYVTGQSCHNHLNHFKMFFRIRLNPNAQFGPRGRTLLQTAAVMGEVKLVSAFCQCKFDYNNVVNFHDYEGNSAMHLAAEENHPQVIITSFQINMRKRMEK